jgi:hypothetical protein
MKQNSSPPELGTLRGLHQIEQKDFRLLETTVMEIFYTLREARQVTD